MAAAVQSAAVAAAASTTRTTSTTTTTRSDEDENSSPSKSPSSSNSNRPPPPPLHSLLPFRDEDLWSADELKIFSDEGEFPDGKDGDGSESGLDGSAAEELREEKSSLIAETELGIKQESSSGEFSKRDMGEVGPRMPGIQLTFPRIELRSALNEMSFSPPRLMRVKTAIEFREWKLPPPPRDQLDFLQRSCSYILS